MFTHACFASRLCVEQPGASQRTSSGQRASIVQLSVPPENFLKVPVRAGEQVYKALPVTDGEGEALRPA